MSPRAKVDVFGGDAAAAQEDGRDSFGIGARVIVPTPILTLMGRIIRPLYIPCSHGRILMDGACLRVDSRHHQQPPAHQDNRGAVPLQTFPQLISPFYLTPL